MLANIPRLTRRMDELGVDAIVATTIENVYYLTGVASVSLDVLPHSAQCYVVVARDRPARPHLVSPLCDLDQAIDACTPLASAVGYGQFFRENGADSALTAEEDQLRRLSVDPPANSMGALARTLRRAELSSGRIAVDEDGVPHGFLDGLREALPSAAVRTGAGILRWTRKVKTDKEIERLRASAAVTERGIRAAVGIARPGVTETDLVREFDRTVAGAGARPRFTLIKFGRNAVAGQRRPGEAPLRRGDAIWFDVGCVLDGYWSDLARVYSLGEPSDKMVRYHAAVLAGVDRALTAARPGTTGKELFDITVEAVRDSGIPHYRRQHVGHGIGVEVYDPVLIVPASDDPLEEATVVNTETPYHEFGFGVVQVEDPFVVRATGNSLLTTLGRKLSTVDEAIGQG